MWTVEERQTKLHGGREAALCEGVDSKVSCKFDLGWFTLVSSIGAGLTSAWVQMRAWVERLRFDWTKWA